MTVTFGTRSAMRELAEELAEGEVVIELAACAYAGAAGLVALTSDRILAIRDDYSKHQVQFARIAEVAWIDYLPTVHDGFAVFTATGRLVVRKMRRADGDRLVDALLERAPHIAIRPTAAPATPATAASPAAAPVPPRPQWGRHRKPVQDGPEALAAADAQGEAARAAAQAPQDRTETATPSKTPRADRGSALGDATGTAPGTVPAAADVVATETAPPEQAATAAAAPGAPRQVTDKEILLGVLADLHAQGVLSAEEFSAKVRQIVTPD